MSTLVGSTVSLTTRERARQLDGAWRIENYKKTDGMFARLMLDSVGIALEPIHVIAQMRILLLQALDLLAQLAILDLLLAPYIRYAKSEELSIPVKDRKVFVSIIESLKATYHDGRISELDGLTVEYDDWWFNLRPSNTEPVLRLVVETNKKDLLEGKVLELRKVIG